MNYPPERKPESTETQDYRGYKIEMLFYPHPDSTLVPMHVHINKGSTSMIVPFSRQMPTRDFATKDEARRIGIAAAQIEIDRLENDCT